MTALASRLTAVSRYVGYLAASLIFVLVFATSYEVVSRYLFASPTIWAFELGYMGMGAHFLLAAAFTLSMQGHVRVDLIYGYCSIRTRSVIDALQYLVLMMPISAWLTWELLDYALDAFRTGERTGFSAWNPHVWPYRIVFSAAFGLLTLQLFAQGALAVVAFRNSTYFGKD